jgi:hypothetical protein
MDHRQSGRNLLVTLPRSLAVTWPD